MIKFDISIDELLKLKLGFEEYFILYCRSRGDKLLMLTYVNQCKPIDTKVFKALEAKGLISIMFNENDENVYFENISLTEDGKAIFTKRLSSYEVSRLFKEFRTNYPSLVRDPRTNKVTRRLHGNPNRCIDLYRKALEEGTSHDDMCKCARVYAKEKRDSNSENFMKALETWLNQKDYLMYVDEKDVEAINDVESDGNIDVI